MREKFTKEQRQHVYDTYIRLGSNGYAAARELGCSETNIRHHLRKYKEENCYAAGVAEENGIPFDRVSQYWIKTKNTEGNDVSLFVKNDAKQTYEEIRDLLIEDMNEYTPKYQKIIRQETNNENLLIVDPADIHIGKFAVKEESNAEYNIDIAINRTKKGITDILSKAKDFGIGKITLVVGNDILHIDNKNNTTTGGTPQDTNDMWWRIFTKARELYVDIIESCLTIADVNLIFCPSNHDYHLGFTLTDSLYSWFRNHPNVTITDYGRSINHRKYISFGNNLIGFTHGDGAKNKDLSNLMQYEAREYWATAKFAYWYVHHLHHKVRSINNTVIEKDNIGVTVIDSGLSFNENNTIIEVLRSPSAADSWHHKKGYISMPAIEAFIHHPVDGQIARLTSYV